MNLQYISDGSGHITAMQLQIPIEDWAAIKKKYKEFEEEEKFAGNIPGWQIELGKEELLHIANATARLMDWQEAKKQFKS